jgi:hypothetical protein
MAADLNLLVTDFKGITEELLHRCSENGIEMRPTEGLRTPFTQAIYWRQSRTREEIQKKVAQLKKNRAHFLADCIESVGPRNGPHITNCIPGYSWHQWGEAVDCMWVVNNRAEWSLRKKINGMNGYSTYALIAKQLGLDAGMLWRRFKDAPHVQLRPAADPSKLYSLREIDQAMEQRFSNEPPPAG